MYHKEVLKSLAALSYLPSSIKFLKVEKLSNPPPIL